jgi:hypothetical protein
MMSDMTGFTRAAREGVVTVVFKKIFDGEIRVMPCTLNVELSNHNVPEIMEQKETNDHLVVWCLDKEGWRSFRVDTVIEWYKGSPKEQALKDVLADEYEKPSS